VAPIPTGPDIRYPRFCSSPAYSFGFAARKTLMNSLHLLDHVVLDVAQVSFADLGGEAGEVRTKQIRIRNSRRSNEHLTQ